MRVLGGNWNMPKKRNVSASTAKKRAGKILTDAINEIAKEETELVKNAGGEDKMVNKAEALARLIWKSALGYTLTTIEGVTAEEIVHPPSLAHQNILLDRMAGKAATSEPPKGDKKSKLADKLSDEAVKRINKI